MNVEKSENRSSNASPYVIRTFEDRGDGLILGTVHSFNQEGEATFSQYAVKHDGRYYPYQTRGAQNVSSIAYMPTDDPRHYEWCIRVEGIPTNCGTTSVSDDLMTMTIRNNVIEDGQPLTVVSVYDRR